MHNYIDWIKPWNFCFYFCHFCFFLWFCLKMRHILEELS
jgi:hypothetical protein